MEETSESQPVPPPAAPRRRAGRFLKQPVMLRVLYALVPVFLAGIYFFGWRVPALLAVCTAAGLATEWLMASRMAASTFSPR